MKRKDFMELDTTELNNLGAALNQLWTSGFIQTFAQLHNANFNNGIHWGPAFLPWHRDFLRDLEVALQGINSSITLPYWDWTRSDSQDLDSGRWKTFLGGRNNTGGQFDHWTYTRRSNDGGRTLPDLATVVGELNTGSFLQFRAIESGSHVPGHTWTGGTMAGGSSPLDPLFYLHHCNLDRLWAIWQRNHASLVQYEHTGSIGSDTVPAARVPIDSPMIGGATPRSMLVHTNLGYRYGRDQRLETAWTNSVGTTLVTGDFGFQSPVLGVNNFGYNTGGWRVALHPRVLADTTGDGRADIVGFGNAGVYVSRSNGDRTFTSPTRVVSNFGLNAGGWLVSRHPRFLADTTGDGRADIVGFGYAGAYVSRNNGDGTFSGLTRVVNNFGYTAGGWRVERHPRFLADTTGDGRADIVGFGNAGVYVSRNNGNGTFAAPARVVDNFGYTAGGWRVDRHPRFLADTTGDGRVDIVGFGNAGVYVSRNNGNGTFGAPVRVVNNFGFTAGGWRVDRHPRFLADTTGDGRADIVGFGNAGVYVSRNNGDGTFAALTRVVDNFGYTAGGWRVGRHPRFIADLTGDGRADIVGFGYAGVYFALNNGDGSFQAVSFGLDNFGYSAGGWRVDRHPRLLADVTGNGLADIVGFGNAGAWVSGFIG